MPDSLHNLANNLSPTRTSTLQVKIFADGADLKSMLEIAKERRISGFTTNPTLMRKAGIKDYEAFGRELVRAVPDRHVSFEVLSDEFDEMEQQALRIASWGRNVYVKVPVTNTRRQSAAPLIDRLSRQGVKVNVTAVMTLTQVEAIIPTLRQNTPACISVFAGRIADAGCDPIPILCGALLRLRTHPNIELIWASPREVFNIVQADTIGCHIITVTHDLLKKMHLLGRDLDEYSLDTVRMFYEDARAAEYSLTTAPATAPVRR